MARTQEQRKTETRTRLLAAASDLFARRGFHATSTDAVADAAERTSGSVYAHFGGKEGLLLALVDEWGQRAATLIEDDLDSATTGAQRRSAIWAQVVARPGGEGAEHWLLLEHELALQAARDPQLGRHLARRYAAGRRAMGEAFEQWADPSAAPLPLSGEQVATLVLGLLLGLELQRRLDPAAVPDSLAEAGLDLLFGEAPDRADVDPAHLDPPR